MCRIGDFKGLVTLRLDKSAWVSRAVEVTGSVGRGWPKKTWEEVTRIDLR